MKETTHKTGYVMLLRNQLVLELLEIRPTAFLLLTQIALRIKRSDGSMLNDLAIGEARVGDFGKYGVSEQVYRSDKRFLEKYHLATFKPTSRGTIVRLANTYIFDVNLETSTDEETKKQRDDNGSLTTNNNDKNEKNVKKENAYSTKLGFEETFIEEMKTKFPLVDVENQFERARDWLASTGKNYKDYKAFFRNWLRNAKPIRREAIIL